MNTQNQILIRKYSGEQEPVNAEQLRYALDKSGEDKKLATNILLDVESKLCNGIPGLATNLIFKWQV